MREREIESFIERGRERVANRDAARLKIFRICINWTPFSPPPPPPLIYKIVTDIMLHAIL